jgi:hypothetical protein
MKRLRSSVYVVIHVPDKGNPLATHNCGVTNRKARNKARTASIYRRSSAMSKVSSLAYVTSEVVFATTPVAEDKKR